MVTGVTRVNGMTARKRQRGFTLVEMLVVMALAVVGLLGLLAMQVVALRGHGDARFYTEATALAQDRLERMMRVPFATLAGSSETGLGPQGKPVAGGAYTRTTTVAAGATLTSVTVVVSWTGTDGRSHSVNVRTMRSP